MTHIPFRFHSLLHLLHRLPCARYSQAKHTLLTLSPSLAVPLRSAPRHAQKLADAGDQILESSEERCRWAVLHLYEALRAGDLERAHRLLAPDIEWWFHGPKEHQRHMISLLSGDDAEAFVFEPQSVAAFGSTVVVEGCCGRRNVAWVHAWTVSPDDGVITQLREYLDTSLTVTRVESVGGPGARCRPLWQSRLHERGRKSLPGLVLAI